MLRLKRKRSKYNRRSININHNDSRQTVDENSAEAVWIRTNVKRRQCNKFVLNKTGGSGLNICKCGLPEGGFHKEVEGLNWDVNENTVATEATNAYGEIVFIDKVNDSISKYARVDVKTDMNIVLDLLTKQWKLHLPNFILTVTGGAKAFDLKENLKQMFRKGLMKAAQSTGAWIITGGMDAGVMSHVGEAVHDYSDEDEDPIVCLGIAPWGCVAHNERYLVNPMGKWPAKYRKDELTNPNSSHIDSNHTHFIFVDNGTSGIFGTEIEFRTRLESAISTMKTDTDDSVNIPLCCVVVEGGPGTLETVRSSLEMGCPVVIIDGSGRAANILSYAYLNSKKQVIEEYDKNGQKQLRLVSKINDTLRNKIYGMLKESFGENNIEQHLDSVEQCLANRDFLTIFDFQNLNIDARDLDVAILKALMKANKNQVINQLNLALTWSRVDIAQQEIFTEDRKWQAGDLDDLFFRALVLNNSAFVRLFIESGVILKKFLSIERLIKLYNNIPQTDPGKVLINRLLLAKRKSNSRFISLENVGDVAVDLIGEFYQTIYRHDNRYKDLDPDCIMKGNFKSDPDIVEGVKDRLIAVRDTKYLINVTDDIDRKKKKNLPHFNDPARELFLWCVLSGRHDISLLFWEELKESIAAALTAETLFNSLSSKIDDSEMKELYKNYASEYGALAIGVLQECFSKDITKAQLLLIRNSTLFGNTTCLQLAEEGNKLKFISHSVPQTLLNNIWMGRMSMESNSSFKLFLAVFGFVLLPLWPLIVNLIVDFEKSSEKSVDNGDEEAFNEADNDEDNVEFISSNKKASFFVKFFAFLYAPIIKFSFNCIFYILFLTLYSFILLCRFRQEISFAEIILIIWVISLSMEEIRQAFFSSDENTFKAQLLVYLADKWNIIDLICVGMFIVGEILRNIDNLECFAAARIILALDLILFYGRMLNMFTVHPQLGPILEIIFKMMIDMSHFLVILLIFVTAYGIALHAVLYPNSETEWKLVFDILKKSYFQMYGELFLEELEGANTCSNKFSTYLNDTSPRCPTEEGKIISPIILGFYILMTNILMFNLLIAMFSFTFEKIYSNTNAVWRFQRMSLIREFTEKPLLPPPFIFINHIYLIMRRLFSSCGTYTSKSPFRNKFSYTKDKQLMAWESHNADEYIKRQSAIRILTPDFVINKMKNDIIAVNNKVDLLLENFSDSNSTNVSPLRSLSPTNEMNQRLLNLDTKLNDFSETLALILKNIQSSKIDIVAQAAYQNSENALKSSEEKIEKLRLPKIKSYTHINSRTTPYVSTDIKRQKVADGQVDWTIPFPTYWPIVFTHDAILNNPPYADIDILLQTMPNRDTFMYNKFDQNYLVNRTSYHGEYQIVNGVPLNPMGRTGLAGRGLLGRFGPNHAADCMVTRWKRNKKDAVVTTNGLPWLEIIMVMRSDSKRWAIPGALVFDNCNQKSVCQILKKTFMTKAASESSNIDYDEFFDEKDSVEIYAGYVDDPRNTDNSWIETKALNFHDNTGQIVCNINLKAGGSCTSVRWMTVSSEEAVFASHLSILEALAKHHNASF